MDCPQCGVRNEPASESCERCGAALSAGATSSAPGTASVPVSAAKSAGRVFRDPKRLTKWVQWLLIGVVVLDVVGAASEFAQFQLLSRMRDGGFASDAEMTSAAESNDVRQGVIGITMLLVYIATVVAFSVWVHRANSNLHALGCQGLRFTPGWAVGWFFVPIANLWKPFQAMKEIWRASKNPANWQAETTGSLLGWWWFWWVVSSIVGNISGRLTFQAETLDAMIGIGPLNIAASALDLISAVFAFRVVKRIGGFQAMAADRSLSAVFA
jgi:hypothetical protein